LLERYVPSRVHLKPISKIFPRNILRDKEGLTIPNAGSPAVLNTC